MHMEEMEERKGEERRGEEKRRGRRSRAHPRAREAPRAMLPAGRIADRLAGLASFSGEMDGLAGGY